MCLGASFGSRAAPAARLFSIFANTCHASSRKERGGSRKAHLAGGPVLFAFNIFAKSNVRAHGKQRIHQYGNAYELILPK